MVRAALMLCVGFVLAAAGTAAAQAGPVTETAWLDAELRDELRKPLPRLDAPAARPLMRATAAAGARAPHIVGAVDRDDVDDLIGVLRRLGTVSRVDRTLATIRFTPDDGAALERVRSDPRVAFVERDALSRLTAEPFETVDPASGWSYTWWFDHVRAADALALVPGAPFPVAVIDSGAEMTHPDLAGKLVGAYNATYGGADVTDYVGHGTFVSALITAPANGVGIRGVAGTTPVMPIRASIDGTFYDSTIAHAIVYAVDRGARVINMSLGGPSLSEVEKRALIYAYLKDVVLVASAGNGAASGNPIMYPAGFIGGYRGGWGIGLSVAATRPDDGWAPFSTYNDYVGIAAPGASQGSCRFGVLSAIPANMGITGWDSPSSCPAVFGRAYLDPGRWAYGEGTSFSAPIVAGAAALVLAAKPSLSSDQVARVLQLSARRGAYEATWNPYTGFGVVDIRAALEIAATYDTVEPFLDVDARPIRNAVRIIATAEDEAGPGEQLAGGVSLDLDVSRDGGATYETVMRGVASIDMKLPASAAARLAVRVWACDANRNCELWQKGSLKALPNQRPFARALGSAGRRGRPVLLKYTLRDDGGRTRETIVVRRPGGKVVTTIRTRFAPVGIAKAGRYHVRWRIPEGARPGRYVFCVVATDGHLSSPRSCAFLRVLP